MAIGDITQCDIVRRRGDTKDYVLVLKDGDGNFIDVNGFTAKLSINTEKFPDIISSPVVGSEIFTTQTSVSESPVRSPLDGRIRLVMAAFATQSPQLTPGSYFYDIQVTDADNAVCTVLWGKFKIVQDIAK